MKYLFDLDGTLVDTDKLNRDAYRYALEKLGYNQKRPEFFCINSVMLCFF